MLSDSPMPPFAEFLAERAAVAWILLRRLTLRKMWLLGVSWASLILRRSRSGKIPPILIIKITSRCNFSCVMCPKTSLSLDFYKNPVDMDFLRLQRLLTDNAGSICLVQLHGGEPLYHKDIGRIIDLLDRLNLTYTVTTNGYLLTREISLKLMRNCLRLILSIDAADPVLYGHIRRGGDLDILRDNILQLQRLKKKFRSPRPIVKVVMAVFKYNLADLTNMVRFCRAHEIRELIFQEGVLYDNPGLGPEDTLKTHAELALEMSGRAKALAKNLGVKLRIDFPGLKSSRGSFGTSCFYLYFTILFQQNFMATYCFGSYDHLLPYLGPDLAGFWNGPQSRFVEARWNLRRNFIPKICQDAYVTGVNCVLKNT